MTTFVATTNIYGNY